MGPLKGKLLSLVSLIFTSVPSFSISSTLLLPLGVAAAASIALLLKPLQGWQAMLLPPRSHSGNLFRKASWKRRENNSPVCLSHVEGWMWLSAGSGELKKSLEWLPWTCGHALMNRDGTRIQCAGVPPPSREVCVLGCPGAWGWSLDTVLTCSQEGLETDRSTRSAWPIAKSIRDWYSYRWKHPKEPKLTPLSYPKIELSTSWEDKVTVREERRNIQGQIWLLLRL